jgi:hypothetical protein
MKERLVETWISANPYDGNTLIANPKASFAYYDPDDHPVYKPDAWFDFYRETNCYAYALSAPGEEIIPGFLKKGKTPEKYKLADIYNRTFRDGRSVAMEDFQWCVRRGCEIDGLLKVDKKNSGELYRPGFYLVALCFCEEPALGRKDFHFLVLNSNGRWSDMNGTSSHVSCHDVHENVILSPLTAFLGNTTVVDSFYHVPRGGAPALRAA